MPSYAKYYISLCSKLAYVVFGLLPFVISQGFSSLYFACLLKTFIMNFALRYILRPLEPLTLTLDVSRVEKLNYFFKEPE